MPASFCPCLLGLQWSCNSAINRPAPERQQDSYGKKQQLKLENLDLQSNFSGHQSVHLCNWSVNDKTTMLLWKQMKYSRSSNYIVSFVRQMRCCRDLTLVHVNQPILKLVYYTSFCLVTEPTGNIEGLLQCQVETLS